LKPFLQEKRRQEREGKRDELRAKYADKGVSPGGSKKVEKKGWFG
jgi:hypothetical protein